MSNNQPLILTLLHLLINSIRYIILLISTITWYPLKIYFITAERVLKSKLNNFTFWITIPFRWIIASLVFPLMVMYVVLVGCVVYRFSQNEGTFVIVVSVTSSIIGFISLMLHGYKLTRDQYNLEYLYNQTFALQYQALAFVCSVIVCCLVTRLYHLFRDLGDSSKDPIYSCFRNFRNTLLDYLTMPFLLIVLITGWRVPLVYRNWEKCTHGFVIFQALKCIIELFIFIICIPPIIVTVYRAPSLIKKLWNSHEDSRAELCVKEFLNFLVDIPFILMLLVLTFTWRSYIVYSRIYKYYNVGKRKIRIVIVVNFFMLWMDPVILAGVIFLLVTVYRAKHAWNWYKSVLGKMTASTPRYMKSVVSAFYIC